LLEVFEYRLEPSALGFTEWIGSGED